MGDKVLMVEALREGRWSPQRFYGGGKHPLWTLLGCG